jgi:hypothetical protein
VFEALPGRADGLLHGKTNSLGCVPAIHWSGYASASPGSAFSITCTNVLNQKSGLLFYGYDVNSTPFQGGTLCVQSPTVRTPIQTSGGATSGSSCSGTYALDFERLDPERQRSFALRVPQGVRSVLVARSAFTQHDQPVERDRVPRQPLTLGGAISCACAATGAIDTSASPSSSAT